MRKISAVESISLDGVMQAPGRPDEDERGGFTHGGWAVPLRRRPGEGRVMGEGMRAARPAVRPPHVRGLPPLLGRAQTDNPFTAAAERAPQVRRLPHAAPNR